MNTFEKTLLWISLLLNIALVICLLVMYNSTSGEISLLKQELAGYAELELSENAVNETDDAEIVSNENEDYISVSEDNDLKEVDVVQPTTTAQTTKATEVSKTTTTKLTTTTTTKPTTAKPTAATTKSNDNDGDWVDGWY